MRLSVPLLFVLALGCKPTDVDSDTAVDAVDLGADPAVMAADGEARAGVIREGVAGEEALFGGINAEGAAGDLKIYNHNVQFIIQAAGRSHGLIDVGGGIIDADRVRHDDTLGRDLVEDLFLAFGLSRVFEADRVEIVADGSDGGDAVIVAHGTDVGWDYFMGMFERDEPLLDDLNLDITHTYRLSPDSWVLDVTTDLVNTADEPVTFTLSDGLFLSGEDAVPWYSGPGYDGPNGTRLPSVIYSGASGEGTLAQWPEEGDYSLSGLASLTGELGILLGDYAPTTLASGDSISVTRHLMLGTDPAAAESARLAHLGETVGTVSGTVTDGSVPVAGARVHIVDAEGQVRALALTDRDGAYTAALAPGEHTVYALGQPGSEYVQLPAGVGRTGPFTAQSVNDRQLDALSGTLTPNAVPWARGHAASPGQAATVVADTPTTVDLVVSEPGMVRIDIRDPSGEPMPALIELRYSAGAPSASTVPSTLHPAFNVSGSGRAAWGWTSTGVAELPALPGTYDVFVGHSWRHTRDEQRSVVVGAGDTAQVDIVLDEVVPRNGWFALDPHLHAAPSFDGALPMEDRIVTCAAAGVDFPVTTDHDAMTDYRPLNTAMGLDDRMRIIPGLEVTSLLRGHFNMFPMNPQPHTLTNGGAVEWWLPLQTTDELFERMRAAGTEETLIQVNHPRSPGMFGFAGYDAVTAEPGRPEFFSRDFDLFELLNGGAEDVEQIRADWFSFLNAGDIRVPTGASDTHYRYIPCGMAHTDVYLDVADVTQASTSDVRDAVAAGHVVVASGTTLRATLTSDHDGTAIIPGDTLPGSRATLSARVQTPDWFEPGTLRVYANGEVIFTEVLDTVDDNGVWFDGSWPIGPSTDTWYVVEVQGSGTMGDTWRNQTPYAITNAFFLDVGSDGWTAPGQP